MMLSLLGGFMKKLVALISLLTLTSAFALVQAELPNWVLPNTKAAALEQAYHAAEDVKVLGVFTEQVSLDDGYSAIKATVYFDSLDGSLEQIAICNPIKNKLLCRYTLSTEDGQVITQSEGIFFRKE